MRYFIDFNPNNYNFRYDAAKISIFGHSMGGHGALTIGLKNPGMYKSVSAFAPVSNPQECPWGKKAFAGYLNDPEKESGEYDTCALLKSGKKHPNPLMVDVGTKDDFLTGDVNQLLTQNLEAACKESGQELKIRYCEGYNHSYFFMTSFLEDHIKFHAQYL